MALVSVTDNYQVAIPRDVREAAGLEVGDVLDAQVEAGKITLTRQSSLDRGIAESFADYCGGTLAWSIYDN